MTQQRKKPHGHRHRSCGILRAWGARCGPCARSKLNASKATERRGSARPGSHSARRARAAARPTTIADSLRCVMAADGSPAFDMLASRGTAEAAAHGAAAVAGSAKKQAQSRQLPGAPSDKLATKIVHTDENQRKKSAQLQMQTTKTISNGQVNIPSPSKRTGKHSFGEAKIRGPKGNTRASGSVIRKRTRTRTLRSPYSLLATTSLAPVISRETPDVVARVGGGEPGAATASTIASGRAESPLARPMPTVSAPSTSSSSSIIVETRRAGPEQSEIQTIIDRLRQKSERAPMAPSGNRRPELGQKLSGSKPEAAASASAAASADEMELIKSASRAHQWQWSDVDKSYECIVSKDKLSLCFHPKCSESAAACRGSEPFRRNGNYYYWEIHVQDKIYGTSVMFGLCTKKQRLHANEYCNLVGLDETGWSLSHKGFAWHHGKSRQFTQMFPLNQPITIGLLYNTMRGELSYFMDGKNLGVAFSGLNDIAADLYPVVGSTAKCTRMRLVGSYCGYVSLLERSCFTLLKSARSRAELVDYLRQCQLPKSLLDYLAQAANVPQNGNAADPVQAKRTKRRGVAKEDNYQAANDTGVFT